MSFILFFLLFKQMFLLHTCIIFIFLHGLISTYMFFIVDILQRRFKSRSHFIITGVSLYFPSISKYIWVLILIFSGFPLTVKFFIEWELMCLLLGLNKYILIIVIFIVNVLGVIFFSKIMFNILYGVPSIENKDLNIQDLQLYEKVILNTLIFLILLLLPILFII